MEPTHLIRDFNLQNAHTFVRVVEAGGIARYGFVAALRKGLQL
jgi:hypothetical protein